MKEKKEEVKKEEQLGAEKKPRQGSILRIIGVAFLLAFVMIVATIWSVAQQGGKKLSSSLTIAKQGNEMGSSSAPVVVEEYADFQCPACGAVFHLIEPRVKKEYVATGKVRWIFRHFTIIGQESEWAAQAAKCAQDQEKFWEYHDLLFENQRGENIGTFSIQNLKNFAQKLKLDMQAFNECFDSGKYVKAVQEEALEGQARGVRSTPSFFINGLYYQGAPRVYETFKGWLEDALRSAGASETQEAG